MKMILKIITYQDISKSNLQLTVIRDPQNSNRLIFFGSNMCCQAIKGLFLNPGKHGGEATVEAVQLIADFVRLRNCQLPPDLVQVIRHSNV